MRGWSCYYGLLSNCFGQKFLVLHWTMENQTLELIFYFIYQKIKNKCGKTNKIKRILHSWCHTFCHYGFQSSEAVTRMSFVKKISQNSHENIWPHPATLLKKRFWNRCFPVNFVKFLKTPFLTEHLWWLLLNPVGYARNWIFCLLFFLLVIVNKYCGWQRYIQNPVKHLKWRVLRR